MAGDRSRLKLLEFLDYVADKGLTPRATAANRKAAVGKVLGILSEEEATDVTNLDLEDVMTRFHNLEGKSYTPGSLSAYLSRVRSAVEDFKSYLENPLAFRPNNQARERKKPDTKKDGASPNDRRSAAGSTEERSSPVRSPLSASILPIPIRPDVTVFVQGLPYDLTEAEANKIANVVRAMATPA